MHQEQCEAAGARSPLLEGHRKEQSAGGALVLDACTQCKLGLALALHVLASWHCLPENGRRREVSPPLRRACTPTKSYPRMIAYLCVGVWVLACAGPHVSRLHEVLNKLKHVTSSAPAFQQAASCHPLPGKYISAIPSRHPGRACSQACCFTVWCGLAPFFCQSSY